MVYKAGRPWVQFQPLCAQLKFSGSSNNSFKCSLPGRAKTGGHVGTGDGPAEPGRQLERHRRYDDIKIVTNRRLGHKTDKSNKARIERYYEKWLMW